MKIILKLSWKYLKLNKKRTLLTITGIAFSVLMMTVITIFIQSFLTTMQKEEMDKNGSYHALFHQLTTEQTEELEKINKVKNVRFPVNCVSHPSGQLKCAEVEMRHVGNGIFSSTQRIAKGIGMNSLSENEREMLPNRKKANYNVTYHMKLLEYYGVSTVDSMGIGLAAFAILILIIIISSVLINQSFAASVRERARYVGLLGSVGATRMQKAMCILFEGIVEGAAGITCGIVSGIVMTKVILWMLYQYFYQTSRINMVYGISEILIILLCSVLAVVLSCLAPAMRAADTTVMDLIRPNYENVKESKKYTSLRKRKAWGAEGALAIKHIFLHKAQYFRTCMLMCAALCLLLVGHTYFQGLSGAFDIKDKREIAELSTWVDVYSNDSNKIQEFYNKLQSHPEINTISLERTLDIQGILLDEQYLEQGMEEINMPSLAGYYKQPVTVEDMQGRKKAGMLVRTPITGIDEISFAQYAENVGVYDPGTEEYPVIADDQCVFYKDGGTHFQKLFQFPKSSDFNFVFSKAGDMEYLSILGDGSVDELADGKFYMLGGTRQLPQIPHYSGEPAKPKKYHYLRNSSLKLYMPMHAFEKLLQDENYKSTYGTHSSNTVLLNYWESKSIKTYIKFDIKRNACNQEWSLIDKKLRHRDVLQRIKEDEAFQKNVRRIAAEVGLRETGLITYDMAMDRDIPQNDSFAFGSVAMLERDKLLYSDEILMQIFVYGLILLIVVFTITNIFRHITSSIRMRRREISLYLSMGMEKQKLYKMLFIENSVYGLVSLVVGMPLSIFLMYRTFDEFGTFQGIELAIPYPIIGLQLVIILLMTILPVMRGLKEIKNMNIIETIKSENL